MTGAQQAVYLTTVAPSVAATGLLIAPVACTGYCSAGTPGTFLFASHTGSPSIGIFLLGTSIIGVVLLIFDLVAGRAVGLIAAAGATLIMISLWAVLPVTLGRHHDGDTADPEAREFHRRPQVSTSRRP